MSNHLLNLISGLSLLTFPFSSFDSPVGNFVRVLGATTAIAGVVEEEINKQKKIADKDESEVLTRIDNAVYVASAKYQNEINKLQGELQQALVSIGTLNSQIQELTQARDACVNGRHDEIDRLQGLLTAQTASFASVQDKLLAEHQAREEAIRREVQNELKKVAQHKHEWEVWKHSDLLRHEALKQEKTKELLTNLEESKKSLFEAAQKNAQTKINEIVADTQVVVDRFTDAIGSLEKEYNNFKEQAARHVISLEGQINALQQQLHQAQRLRYFTAKHGSVGLLGNRMINKLAAFKIYVDADHCEVWQLKKDEKHLEWWFTLREDFDMISVPQIMGKKEDLKLALGLPEAEYNRYDLQMEIDEGNIHISAVTKADVGDVMSLYSKDASTVEIVAAAPYKIKKVLIALHFGIFGQTGAGKSKLAGNIINFLRYYYKTVFNKELKYQLFDLKYPSTDWELDGKKLIPDWKNIEEYREGLLRMQTLLENRIKEWVEAESKGLPKPEFDPYVFIIDESEEAYARLRDIFSKPVGYILRIGRALNVSVMMVGQSPNCSAYGFLKSQLWNMTRCWLGAMTLYSFKELMLPPEYSKPLKLQILARQTKANEELEQGIDPPPSQFYAIASPPSLQPFVFDLPAPDAFNFSHEDLSQIPSDITGVKDVLRELVDEQARNRQIEAENKPQANPNPIQLPERQKHYETTLNAGVTTIELMAQAEAEHAQPKSHFSEPPSDRLSLPTNYQFVYDKLSSEDYKGWTQLRNIAKIRGMGQEGLELILKELISRNLVERSTSKALRVIKKV